VAHKPRPDSFYTGIPPSRQAVDCDSDVNAACDRATGPAAWLSEPSLALRLVSRSRPGEPGSFRTLPSVEPRKPRLSGGLLPPSLRLDRGSRKFPRRQAEAVRAVGRRHSRGQSANCSCKQYSLPM